MTVIQQPQIVEVDGTCFRMALIGHRGAKGVLSPLRLTRPILVQTVHDDLSAALKSNLLLPRRPWQVVTVCSHFSRRMSRLSRAGQFPKFGHSTVYNTIGR